MSEKFYVPKLTAALADRRMINDTAKKLFSGFTHKTCSVEFEAGAENSFVIGECAIPTLPCGKEYAIKVTKSGCSVIGRDFGGLMRGYFALLMKIEWAFGGSELFIAECDECDSFTVERRMIHFCVFPETSEIRLKRELRVAAALGYTHVVIEFWGMLKYDFCKTLAWDNAFTKDEVRKILAEVRELGLKPIPMFNHLGHASASRGNAGKHVVLDSDPTLYRLFTPDGWSFDIKNPDALEFLKCIRRELYELFGECEYFHAGLDEAYLYAQSDEHYAAMRDYLSYLTKEIVSEGRRPLIWMDMLLPPEAHGDSTPEVCSNHKSEDCMKMIAALDRSTVLVDWQYFAKSAPISTAVYLKKQGLDVICAPWLDTKNGQTHIDTVVSEGLYGFMQTTWHTLPRDIMNLIPIARHFGAPKAPWSDISNEWAEMATLLRKISFEHCEYNELGWVENQVSLLGR